MDQFLAAARRLDGAQQAALHTQQGIAGLRKSLTGQKATLSKLISQQSTLLARLTPAQAVGLGPAAAAGRRQPGPGQVHRPTATQAEKAVAFAYAQLGCPYVFGGTGPCHSGFDCSGLTSQAWAAAGVSIGRHQLRPGATSPTSARPPWSPATSWSSPATVTSACTWAAAS